MARAAATVRIQETPEKAAASTSTEKGISQVDALDNHFSATIIQAVAQVEWFNPAFDQVYYASYDGHVLIKYIQNFSEKNYSSV